MSQKVGYFRGIAAIALASFLWATTGTVASFAPAISPLAIGAFAMGTAGVLLVLTAWRRLLKDKALVLPNIKSLMIGGLAVALYPLAFYSSMRLSGVAIGTVISLASAPLFAVMLEFFISQKRVSVVWVVSFIIASVGMLFLMLGKQSDSSVYVDQLMLLGGVGLGLMAGLTYATYSWVAKSMIGQGMHSKSAMSIMFGLAAIVLLPSLSVTGDNLFASQLNASVAIYMAVVPMFLGYLCFGYGLRYVEASKATLITLLEPVVALVLAVFVVGERFSALGWLGALFIFVSLILQIVRRR
ncbi:EamA family transporter [Marinomonas profundi]|nr:EamA family transporter [Marinomonas profundi]UDV03469.1 EamA family transporter [Marinomonas profundi]